MSVAIIAEIGPNHNGDFELAKKMIVSLANAGVDAVKFQLADPYNELSLDAFKAEYQVNNDNAEEIFEATLKRQLSHDQHKELKRICEENSVEYICTAFDSGSLEFLDKELDVQRFKVASGELLSIDMAEYIAKSSKPAIISTGMATEDEIREALKIYNPSNNPSKVTLLHCVSNYPAEYSEVNLLWLPELAKKFNLPVGYSDHTIGNEVAVAAVAFGAVVIEKHVTTDRELPGPDHKASATIDEFALLVSSIRRVEKALGMPARIINKSERSIALVARKSIVSRFEIPKGTKINHSHVCFRRPGTGYLPTQIDEVVGKTTARTIRENRVIRPEDII